MMSQEVEELSPGNWHSLQARSAFSLYQSIKCSVKINEFLIYFFIYKSTNVYTYVRWDVVFNPCNCFWLFRDNHLFMLTKFQLISRISHVILNL